MILRTDSPFAKAALELLERIAEQLPRNMPQPVKAYIAGGVAVHLYTGGRVSRDLDVELDRRVLLPSELTVTYMDESGVELALYRDPNYSSTLGLLHEDYIEDAVLLGRTQRNPSLEVYLFSPVDLAVSKLSRYSDQDRRDICALGGMRLFTASEFKKRATEALSYYVVGQPRTVERNIQDVGSEIERLQGAGGTGK